MVRANKKLVKIKVAVPTDQHPPFVNAVQVKVCIAIALKGLNEIAQGSALGKWHTKTPSPERAKGVVKWLLRPFRAYWMGNLLPGVALRFNPGYLISPLRDL